MLKVKWLEILEQSSDSEKAFPRAPSYGFGEELCWAVKRIQGYSNLKIQSVVTKRLPEILLIKSDYLRAGTPMSWHWLRALWESFVWCLCCIQIAKDQDSWHHSEVTKIIIKKKQNGGSRDIHKDPKKHSKLNNIAFVWKQKHLNNYVKCMQAWKHICFKCIVKLMRKIDFFFKLVYSRWPCLKFSLCFIKIALHVLVFILRLFICVYPKKKVKRNPAEKNQTPSSAKAMVDEETCHNSVVIILAQDMTMTSLFSCQMLSVKATQQNMERKQAVFVYSNEMWMEDASSLQSVLTVEIIEKFISLVKSNIYCRLGDSKFLSRMLQSER